MSSEPVLITRENLTAVLKTILAPSYRDGSSHVVLTSYYGTMDTLVHDLFRKLQEETEKGTPPVSVMVNEGELTSALQEAGYSVPSHRANSLMGILRKRTPMAPAETPPYELITEAELAAAMARIGYADMTTPGHASRIFESALAHRLPNMKKGDVFRDAEGDIFVFDSFSSTGEPTWCRPGHWGSSSAVIPAKPLTRLVPEGQ